METLFVHGLVCQITKYPMETVFVRGFMCQITLFVLCLCLVHSISVHHRRLCYSPLFVCVNYSPLIRCGIAIVVSSVMPHAELAEERHVNPQRASDRAKAPWCNAYYNNCLSN